MIAMIAAIGRGRELGRGGDLIWSLPGDLPRFKRITTGHTVVMGRKTWESLPFRPLKGRRNIVVTANPDYDAPGAEKAASVREVLEMAGKMPDEEIFIIGGASLYREFLPYADILMLTEIDAVAADADTFFPEFQREDWSDVSDASEENVRFTPEGVRFEYHTYRRR